MCSPLALCFSVPSPVVHNVSDQCARHLASTALDNARSYRIVIDLCTADIIAMRSENVLSLVTRSCNSVYGSRSQSSSDNPLCRRIPAVIDGGIASASDDGGEPRHAVHLFQHKLDAELVEQHVFSTFTHAAYRLRFAVE